MNNHTASGAVSACGVAVVPPAYGGVYYFFTAFPATIIFLVGGIP